MSDDSFLDGEEYAAIRDAISSAETRRKGTSERLQVDATPIALIAEDRAADRALPDGQKIVERWLPECKTVLSRVFSKDIEVGLSSAETVDMGGTKRALLGAWLMRLDIQGRRGGALLAVSGPILEGAAVHRFGGEIVPTGSGRPASGTILSLFSTLGSALAQTLGEAWKEAQGAIVEYGDDDIAIERARRALESAKLTVLIELQVKGAIEGIIRLVVSPEVLAAPPPALEAIPAEPEDIAAAIGEVPALVRVEMGQTRIPLRALRSLKPGTVLTLNRFVGDNLPVRCQGIVVAQGRAIISRGALAVEITPRPQGT